MLIAQLDGGVAGHVAGDLLLIGGAVSVLGVVVVAHVVVGRVVGIALAHALLADVAGAHVQADELHVGVQPGLSHQGGGEHVAGKDDDVGAVGNGLVDAGVPGLVGVLFGLEVLEGSAVGLAPGLGGLIGGLVEALVGDVAGIGDHGDLHLRGGAGRGIAAGGITASGSAAGGSAAGGGGIAPGGGFAAAGAATAAAGGQRQDHRAGKERRDKLFHNNSPFRKMEWCFSRLRG